MSKLKGSPKEQCADSDFFQHFPEQVVWELLEVRITSTPAGGVQAQIKKQDCSS